MAKAKEPQKDPAKVEAGREGGRAGTGPAKVRSGRKGGLATLKKYGAGHFTRISRLGVLARAKIQPNSATATEQADPKS